MKSNNLAAHTIFEVRLFECLGFPRVNEPKT